MATITLVGKDKYRATFNRRSLSIDVSAGIKATDTATGEVIEGTELRSIHNFVEWHIKSKRDSSELPTLWTTRGTKL